MSAICGSVVFESQQGTPDFIQAVSKKLQRSGLTHHLWADGPVAMAHLESPRTQEAEFEPMPWRHPQSGLVITADARLDNRRELIHKLELSDASEKYVSSSRLLAMSYLKWGAGCTDHLLGDFAFALWDTAEATLFCARDPMGGRPFYFIQNKERFAFASDSEALLMLPGVSSRPNEQRIAEFLAPELSRPSDRRSWQNDVNALMPGESMTVGLNGKARINTYYRLAPRETPKYASDEEFLEHFQEVFGQAVSCRLDAAHDAAVMASGGLDSAAVLAMSLRQRRDAGIDSFSVIEGGAETGVETQAIRELSQLPGIRPNAVSMSSQLGGVSGEDLKRVAWSRAHPVDNSLLIPAVVFQLAGRCGHDVVLHGASGDVAFATPRFYPEALLRRFLFNCAWRECGVAGQNNVYLLGTSRWNLLARSAYVAWAPKGVQAWISRQRSGQMINGLIDPRFAGRMHTQRVEECESGPAMGPSHPKLIMDMVMSGNVGFGNVARRFGVQASDPWADRRVVEFFFGLPVEYKVRDGWTKYPVRASFDKELPHQVLWRKDKEHLGWKLVRRLMEESQDFIETTLGEDFFFVENYVDSGKALAILRNFRETGDVAEAQGLLSVMSLIVWLKRVDSGASAET